MADANAGSAGFCVKRTDCHGFTEERHGSGVQFVVQFLRPTSQRGVIPDKSRKGGSPAAADDYHLSVIHRRGMSLANHLGRRRKRSARLLAQ